MTQSDTARGVPRDTSGRLALPAIALAAALWAIAGVVASRLFTRGIDPLHLTAARSLVAAGGLALFPAARRGPVTGGARRGVIAWLGIALGLVTATYYLAIARLPVAVAIVLQYTGPALVVLWAGAVGRRPQGGLVLASLAGATSGVVLVTGALSGSGTTLDTVGVAMGLAAAVTFAAYTLLGEAVRATYAPLSALSRAFAVAGAGWAVVLAPGGPPRDLWAAGALGGVLFVSIAGTLLPFLLYVWALPHVRAERAAIAATLEPVLAAAVAWAWLGQGLDLLQLVGGLLVIASVSALQIAGIAAPAATPSG